MIAYLRTAVGFAHREPLWGTLVIRYRNDFHWQIFFQFLWQISFEVSLLNRTFSAETESGHIFGIWSTLKALEAFEGPTFQKKTGLGLVHSFGLIAEYLKCVKSAVQNLQMSFQPIFYATKQKT